jgi:hypothetical protein
MHRGGSRKWGNIQLHRRAAGVHTSWMTLRAALAVQPSRRGNARDSDEVTEVIIGNGVKVSGTTQTLQCKYWTTPLNPAFSAS